MDLAQVVQQEAHKEEHTIDPLFRVEVIAQMPNPQQVIYAGMHQDYCEDFVHDQKDSWPTEEKAGEIIVKRLLAGGRGHYGCTEHSQIVFNAGWFPHSVMQQGRTHRIGCSWDCQSMRYTGQRIVDAATGKRTLEEVFYLRPVGFYTDRKGKKYAYTEEERAKDLKQCKQAAVRYAELISQGFAEEHARGTLPFDYRQHFVVSFNARSLMHFMDLRAKLDAQLEITQLCDLIWPHFENWLPDVAAWYKTNRLHKARLAP